MLRRVPRWSWIVAGVVVVYAALGFLLLPWVLRRQLEAKLPPLLHRPVTVRQVRFNPFDISLTVRGFSVREKDGSNFVSFEELKVDLAFLRLLIGRIRFEEISLQKPEIDVSLLPGGRLNFSDLLDGPPSPKDDKPPPVISIERLRIDAGSVGVADLSRGAPVHLRLAPLSLHLDNFTTEPAKDSPYEFVARMDPGATLSWSGDLSINPLHSAGTLAIENVPLKSFAPYLAESADLKLADGFLSVRGKYRFDATKVPLLFELEEGHAEIDKLRLDGPGERGPLIELTKLAARGVRFDLARSRAGLDELALEGGSIRVRRGEDGSIELRHLLHSRESRQPAPAEEPEPFHTALKKLRVAGLHVEVEDLVPEETAHFDFAPIDLTVGPLEWPTEAAIPLALSIGVNQDGLLTVKGSARPNGDAEVDVGLERIALAWAQPYVSESSNAQVRGGVFTLAGRAKRAAGKTTFAGAMSVDGLSVFAAGASREIVGFDRFALDGVALKLPPNDVRIDRVLLRGLRGRVLKNEDKTTNIAAMSKGPPTPPPAEKAPPPPSTDRYAIRTFVVENGTFEYRDRSVVPPFAVKIARIAGKATPISWPNPARTRFGFSAKVDAAPWEFAGEVEPLGPRKMNVNAVMTMKGWDLIPTTGYALGATGYPVQQGKFSLDLKYRILDRQVEGENVFVVDRLTLGERQDVPGATGLPVKLALAILTDRNGVLTADLPVSGDLDDPGFSFRKLIWAAVENLLIKVATSPFALLGALTGSSEDLSSVSFAAGSSDLPAAEVEKLRKLGKVLFDRPALKIEIEGKVDAKTDGEALRRIKLDQRFTAGRKAPLVAQERERLVRTEWMKLQELAGKPVDPKAFPPPASMEAELLANLTLDPAELAELAADRAHEAQGKLLEVQGLTPERVFVTAPKADPNSTATPSAAMALK